MDDDRKDEPRAISIPSGRSASGARGGNAKRWAFTVNNPRISECSERRTLKSVEDAIANGTALYCIVGWETSSTGTPHLQGYVELAKRQRLNWLKIHISERAHWEVARASRDSNVTYCKKDGDYVEVGKPSESHQGKRTDIEAAKAIIDSGRGIEDVADECFGTFLRYERGIRAYYDMQTVQRDWKTDVYVYWGPTGTGKTRRVHEDEEDLWVASDNSLKWFDGYNGQEAVLFDDFVSIRNDKFGFLLQLLDRYPMRVPVKGRFVNWAPKRIYFTSNLPVEEWYTGVKPAQIAALNRRITKQTRFHGYTSGSEDSAPHFI